MKRTSRSKFKLTRPTDPPPLPWNRLEFGSCLERAREAEEEILDCCRRHHFKGTDLFAIKLALEEGLVNAVKHGNKMDPAKRVRVLYRISDQRADIAIEDEGGGFNPGELPDPCAEENLERCSGRGIHLMRAYMNSVVFNPRGNKVTLTKFPTPMNEAATG